MPFRQSLTPGVSVMNRQFVKKKHYANYVQKFMPNKYNGIIVDIN